MLDYLLPAFAGFATESRNCQYLTPTMALRYVKHSNLDLMRNLKMISQLKRFRVLIPVLLTDHCQAGPESQRCLFWSTQMQLGMTCFQLWRSKPLSKKLTKTHSFGSQSVCVILRFTQLKCCGNVRHCRISNLVSGIRKSTGNLSFTKVRLEFTLGSQNLKYLLPNIHKWQYMCKCSVKSGPVS